MNGRASVSAAFASLCVIWGSTWIAIKFGVESVPTFLSAALRFVVAAAVLLLVAGILRRKLPRSRTEWAATVLVGVILFVGDYGLIYWGEANGVPSGLTAVLFAIMPLLTALAAHGLLRTEPLTAQKLVGILIGFGGVVLIFRGQLASAGASLFFPMLAVVLAAACGGVGTVIIKGWAHEIDAFTFNGLAMAVGAAGLAALSLASGEAWAVPSWPSGFAPILYLALLGSVVAFVTYKWLLGHMEATSASFLTLITPVVALFLGALLANETLEPFDAIGIAVTLLGIYVSISKRVAALGRIVRTASAAPPSNGK